MKNAGGYILVIGIILGVTTMIFRRLILTPQDVANIGGGYVLAIPMIISVALCFLGMWMQRRNSA